MGEWLQAKITRKTLDSGSRHLLRGVSPQREAEDGPQEEETGQEAPGAAALLGLCK